MNTKPYLYVKAFSEFGSFMDMIVLNVMVYAATGSEWMLALTMAFRTLGFLASSLVSGVLADRMDRRRIMIISDVARAASILLIIPFPNPYVIMAVSFFIGVFGSYFQVSFSAEVPNMFGEERIIETNALIARLTSVSMVAGFIFAGAVTDVIGNETVLVLDAVTYLLSAWVLVKMKWPSAPKGRGADLAKAWSRWGEDVREVMRYLRERPNLLMINLSVLIGTFAASSHNLGIPLLAEELDPSNQTFFYGMIWGVWGVGNILTTMLLPKWSALRERMFLTFYVSALGMSACFITFLSSTSLWIVFPFAFVTGVFDAAYVTLTAAIMQKSEDLIRGRIFGVSMLLRSLGFASGFLVAPLVMNWLTMPQLVWLFHGTFILSTLNALLVAFVRSRQTGARFVDTPV